VCVKKNLNFMARITVEKCLVHINNHFKLVLQASKRARQIDIGKHNPEVPWNNDKPSVVALREISLGKLPDK